MTISAPFGYKTESHHLASILHSSVKRDLVTEILNKQTQVLNNEQWIFCKRMNVYKITSGV